MTAIGVVVIAIVYRVVPARGFRHGARSGCRRSWPAWRIVALSQLFLFVAPRLISAALLAGSLATAFIALAWLSFTFQVLLLGAAWVRVRDDRARRRGRRSVSPGGCRSAGRIERSRRVTGRS